MEEFNGLPPAPAAAPAEGVQPDQITDGTGAPVQAAETDAQVAEREAQQRRDTARNNRESYVRRVERDRDRAMALAEQLASNRQPQPQAPTPQAEKAPRREDFQTWEDYEDARVDHRFNQRAKTESEQQAKNLTELLQRAHQEQSEQQLHGQHMQRVNAFAQQVPDFDEVTARDDVVVPGPASEAIKHMPNSPMVLYAIGRDPSLAARMHQMNPTQQAAFVGQISAALTLRPAQVSRAPAPGTPVGGRSGPSGGTPATASDYYDSITKGRGKK